MSAPPSAPRAAPTSTCTLIHSPTFSNLLCSTLRQPSNYIGLPTIRPSSHLEALLHKTSMGRKVRKNEEGEVVGKERAVEDVVRDKEEVERELQRLEELFVDEDNINKKDPNYFLLMKSRARLRHLTNLLSEIQTLKNNAETDTLQALGIADEYDQNRKCPLMLSDAAFRYARSSGNLRRTRGEKEMKGFEGEGEGFFEGKKVERCEGFAGEWVKRVKGEQEEAVNERMEEEGIRTMPYTVTPEVWRRMNPLNETGGGGGGVVGGLATVKGRGRDGDNDPKAQEIPFSPLPTISKEMEEVASLPTTPLAVVYADLQAMGLHVSCGAKFGSDFLIYDGPRDGRHAFGGVRCYGYRKPVRKGGEVGSGLKPPSAPDLAGFVRGLNTVGKIGLLAFVEELVERREGEGLVCLGYRVGYVDLVLEKILSAETHKKRGRTEKRKDMTKNLSKEDQVDGSERGGGSGKKKTKTKTYI